MASDHCRHVSPERQHGCHIIRNGMRVCHIIRNGMQALAGRALRRVANRQFFFALAVVSVLGAKAVHIHTNVTAVSRDHLIRWGYSFFAQDLFLLVFTRLLLDSWVLAAARPVKLLATFVASALLAFVTALGVFNVSFFLVSGSEIHWRNVGMVGDSSSWAMFLSGILYLMLVISFGLAAGYVLQDVFFTLFGFGGDLVKWPAAAILRKFHLINRLALRKTSYGRVPRDDFEQDERAYEGDDELLYGIPSEKRGTQRCCSQKWVTPLMYVFIGSALVGQVVCFFLRPHESSLIFMSWTSALLPFVDFSDSSLALKGLEHVYGLGIGHDWDNITAVHNVSLPTGLTWSQVQTADFWQHYVQEPRYSAAHDPLRISNVKEDVLSSLARKLADVPIRHVVLVFLESTRKDIFPIKKDGLIWRKLSESYENKSLPSDVEERLASLTPNANYLTGDYDDGFPHAGEGERRRGGINFNNAYTSATYTLKSLVGTLCGSSPLVADFNLEVKHRLPTPCLPHVFDAMNHVQPSRRDGDGEAVHEFLADKWQSFFMQSATMDFDSQESLLRQLGYPAQNLISKEYLQGKQGSVPKHGVVNLPDVNYFSLPETPLEEYFRDVFVSAKEKRERVFLTHLSSTTHHPFGVPEDEKYVPMTAQGFDNLSKYINAIGFDDKWLGKILAVLNEQGVAEETLVVMVGDHGASMPENGMDSAYYNPNVGNFHVPLVLSHPKLPVINIDDAVTSIQVLPTVLDLLVETGSLAPEHAQLAKSLAAQNYGGQSMIRNLLKSSKAGQGDWQFTVVNPGRAMVSVRDARRAHFRLIVPVIKNGGWRFTDLELDPTEETPVQNFEFEAFLDMVKSAHGIEVAMWAEEAASIARWWVEENCKRWDYRPDEDS